MNTQMIVYPGRERERGERNTHTTNTHLNNVIFLVIGRKTSFMSLSTSFEPGGKDDRWYPRTGLLVQMIA